MWFTAAAPPYGDTRQCSWIQISWAFVEQKGQMTLPGSDQAKQQLKTYSDLLEGGLLIGAEQWCGRYYAPAAAAA